MATKKDGVPCYDKARDDEELFVLRGQDIFADDLVDEWARRAQAAGVDQKKVDDARECAKRMRKDPHRKIPT